MQLYFCTNIGSEVFDVVRDSAGPDSRRMQHGMRKTQSVNDIVKFHPPPTSRSHLDPAAGALIKRRLVAAISVDE